MARSSQLRIFSNAGSQRRLGRPLPCCRPRLLTSPLKQEATAQSFRTPVPIPGSPKLNTHKRAAVGAGGEPANQSRRHSNKFDG